MTKPEIVNPAVAHTAMFIRRPVSEVFEAVIDPAITSDFWFTKGSDCRFRRSRPFVPI